LNPEQRSIPTHFDDLIDGQLIQSTELKMGLIWFKAVIICVLKFISFDLI